MVNLGTGVVLGIFFVLLLDVQFWHYCVPFCAYVREPPFNHFNSTSSDRLSLASLLTIFISHFYWTVQQNKIKGKAPIGTAPISALQYPTVPPPEISPPPISHLSPVKVRYNLCHSITHCYIPQEENLPCVQKNIFSICSPCYSLDIVTTRLSHPNPLMRWRSLWKTSTMEATWVEESHPWRYHNLWWWKRGDAATKLISCYYGFLHCYFVLRQSFLSPQTNLRLHLGYLFTIYLFPYPHPSSTLQFSATQGGGCGRTQS